MLSYLILHYNRPYLLEINIKLARKYAPANTQLIIADDGSDRRIFDKISKLHVDDLFYQNKNKNEWTNGTCSNTIASSIALVKNKFMLFSEDDFFFCPNPIDDSKMEQDNYIIDLNYNNAPSFNIFDEAMNLMINNKDVINVQLGRDGSGWRAAPIKGEIKTDNVNWNYLDHNVKRTFYYCDWPNIMRISDFRQLPIPRDTAIWSFESGFANAADRKFGLHNWAVIPEKRRYLHVGMPFSKRLNKFAKSAAKRSTVAKQLQSSTMNKIVVNDIESFNKLLLNLWIDGKFFIDFDEMIADGLKKAMNSAFKRIENIV